jgi:hypothetical protein
MDVLSPAQCNFSLITEKITEKENERDVVERLPIVFETRRRISNRGLSNHIHHHLMKDAHEKLSIRS